MELGTVLVFMLLAREAFGQYRHFVFEKPSDFQDQGFNCTQHGFVGYCVIQQANQGEDLPSYFPAPYRQLPGPLMYVETTVNNNQGHFRLESNVQIPGYIVSFRGEYFTHSSNAIGCQNATEDDWHPWPPASPSEDPPRWQEGKWLYVTKSKLQWFGFFVFNQRSSSSGRLEIVIDEEPNLHVRVDSLEDAAARGVECVSASGDQYLANSACKLKSVTETSDLPPYFSNAFRSLAPPNGANIMYVEGVTGELKWHKLLLSLPIQLAPDPVGVLGFSAVYYTETHGGLGYGPIMVQDSALPGCGRWVPLSSANHSLWITDRGDLEPISNMIAQPNSKVGFVAMNDLANDVAVFLRLEIRVWFTPDSVVEDPVSSTSTASPSTSEATFEPSTGPTGYTDTITYTINPDPETSPSESTTVSWESSTATATVSEVSSTEGAGSTTELEAEVTSPATTPEIGSSQSTSSQELTATTVSETSPTVTASSTELESESTTSQDQETSTATVETTTIEQAEPSSTELEGKPTMTPTRGTTTTEPELSTPSPAETTSQEPERTTVSGSVFRAPPCASAAILMSIFLSYLV